MGRWRGALLLLLVCASALDVSWLPADAEGPLPLSASYRAKLRTLCSMKSLPPELANSKRRTLRTMCSKLAADDANVAGSPSGGGTAMLPALALLAAGAAYLYASSTKAPAPGFAAPGFTAPPAMPASQAQVDAARTARLRRFANEDADARPS